mmetsp:Transcript_3380/g.7089  ORF Transcript_3380/g.7089 Transcript_3380/m.7089 type:complete len:253 (-) Transcript_3380:238-996(-)
MSNSTSKISANEETSETVEKSSLRHRSSPVPSLSDSDVSDADEPLAEFHHKNHANDPTILTTNNNYSDKHPQSTEKSTKRSLSRTLSSIASPQTRLSRQSSLPWGHKPSPLIGASCFLFLLPIPLLLRSCYTVPAFLLGCVTITSYLSDHAYTGLESWAHALDRVMAPMALTSCIHAGYSEGGMMWVFASMGAVACHVIAHNYAKKGMYDEFVIWHSLWHAVGSGLVVGCFWIYGGDGSCWEDGASEGWFAV